jgi:hypothetical protein
MLPTVTARNLQRSRVTFPDDLEGERNVLLIAFQQWQQRSIDTWLPFVKQLESDHEALYYYELPVIQSLNPLARLFINEGMRAGIPDSTARERTITLYLDKPAFRQALGLPDEEDIYVLLVDRDGRVLWRTTGEFSPEKGASLVQTLQDGR